MVVAVFCWGCRVVLMAVCVGWSINVRCTCYNRNND